MTYFHPAWLEHQRKRYLRADAYRFAPPGTPEAKMPGWLDPSMTRVRWKEAQEEEARRQEALAWEARRRELLKIGRELDEVKSELAQRQRAWEAECAERKRKADIAWERFMAAFKRGDFRHKANFNPDQPRDELGRWTDEGGAAAEATNEDSVADQLDETPSDQPPSPSPPSSTASGDTEGRVIRVQMAVDDRPIYDQADSALLTPKGVNAASSKQTLKYTLGDGMDYLGGVTVINEDRTLFGRAAPSFGRSVVDVSFDAQVQTADGVSTSSFRIQRELTPGSSITIPWKEFGLLRGPGQVEVTATNLGSLHTGVIIGARRVQQRL